MQVPRSPNAEDRAAIKAEFKLEDAEEAHLWMVVDRVIQECTRHASFERTEPSRKERVKALRDLQRDVERLKKTFELSAPVLRDLLRKTTYADLGGFFTSDALNEIAQQWVGPELQFSLLQRAVTRKYDRLNPAEVDRLTIDGRREVGRDYGRQLVGSVLTAISKPVSSQVELERAFRGGRKPDLYRNYLIQELGRSCPAILGRNATTTKSGRFVMLCEWVIDAVGYDSTGVDKAVPRILKNADLIAASPRKESKKA
jgi:hypothetical protein